MHGLNITLHLTIIFDVLATSHVDLWQKPRIPRSGLREQCLKVLDRESVGSTNRMAFFEAGSAEKTGVSVSKPEHGDGDCYCSHIRLVTRPELRSESIVAVLSNSFW